jgi:hypothetical protein
MDGSWLFARRQILNPTNVKVMAHPLAGANVDRGVEVVTW